MKFIYRFHANVELLLRLSGWSYRKNFNFTQTWKYNIKLHEPKRENGTPLFWVELIFKGYEDAMIFCVFICIFYLELTVREQLMRRFLSLLWYFFENTILKLLDHSYVQSSSEAIRRHFDNGIWNDTLQLKILQT